MKHNFDYKTGRSVKTFRSNAATIEEARAQFDAWRSEQPRRVYLLRYWEF